MSGVVDTTFRLDLVVAGVMIFFLKGRNCFRIIGLLRWRFCRFIGPLMFLKKKILIYLPGGGILAIMDFKLKK